MVRINKTRAVSELRDFLHVQAMLHRIMLCASGYTWIPFIGGFIFSGLAEWLLRLGHYRSSQTMQWAFGCYNMWAMLPLLGVLVVQEQHAKMVERMGSFVVDFVFTLPHLMGIMGLAFIGGMLGALLGRILLKKYFVKAGIL